MRDDDLHSEVQFHIDMRTERHVNAGMTPEDAEALARNQFGDVEAVMNDMRRARLRIIENRCHHAGVRVAHRLCNLDLHIVARECTRRLSRHR